MLINAQPVSCALCGIVTHAVPSCRKVLAFPVEERYDHKSDHLVRESSSFCCPTCHRRNHALLHRYEQLTSATFVSAFGLDRANKLVAATSQTLSAVTNTAKWIPIGCTLRTDWMHFEISITATQEKFVDRLKKEYNL